MHKFLMAATLALPGFLALPAWADVTKEELKKLANAGISEEVIITYIKANGPVAKLSADDLIELKRAGLTEKALAAAVATPAPSSTGTSAVENRTYTAPTTVVYPSAYFGSYDYYRPYGYYYGSYYYPSYSHLHRSHYSSHYRTGHHGGIHASPSHGGHGSGHSGTLHRGGGHHGGGHHGGAHGGHH